MPVIKLSIYSRFLKRAEKIIFKTQSILITKKSTNEAEIEKKAKRKTEESGEKLCKCHLTFDKTLVIPLLLTTLENTITYHNALCLSHQNFA